MGTGDDPAIDAVEPRFGGLTPEQFVAMDQDAYAQACEIDRSGQGLLNAGEYERALSSFDEAIDLVPSMSFWRNNRALALFMLGQLEAAMATCVDVLDRIDDSNVFARSLLIQCADLLGDEGVVAERVPELLAMTPSDPSALVKSLETLGRLRMDEALLVYADEHRSLLDRDCAFYTGIAAANLGDMGRAARDLKRASKATMAKRRAAELLRVVERGLTPPTLDGSFPYASSGGEVVPPGLWERVIGEVQAVIKRDGLDEEREALPAEHVPDLVDVIVRFVRAELDSGADDAEQLLRIAGMLGTPQAVELLRQVATSSFGDDALRMQATFKLQQLGAVTADDKLSMLVNGERTTVSTIGIHLDLAAVPESLPSRAHAQFEQATHALRDGDLQVAEAILTELMESHGDHPVVRQNHAAVLGRSGRLDEALEIQKGTVSRHPGYLPAITSLVLAYVDAGDVDAAKQVIADCEVPERIHPSHYAGYLAAQIVVLVNGSAPDISGAERLLGMAEQIDPELDSVRIAREEFEAVRSLTR